MDNIYTLADGLLQKRIGEKIKAERLRQNITQQSLAQAAEISLSSVKKIESGQLGTFEAFLRCIRTLGCLEWILPLVEEEKMSPSEYYEFRQSAKGHTRKRAAGRLVNETKAETVW